MPKKKTQKEFISECIEVHGHETFDYTSSVYHGANATVDIICKKHNEKFSQRLGKHLSGSLGCSQCIKERYENSSKWTKEFILQEIKSLQGQNGYVDKTKAHPSLTTMALRRFGSWVEACRIAGVKAASDKPIYDICCIKGCGVKVRSSHCKWCETHYYRNRRNGDPEKLQICQYNVNEKIFDEWSDSTAWLIGLLWTDGWMSDPNGVGIHLKDVQLIETARKELNTDVEIKTVFDKKGREYKRFSIANKYLANRLQVIGMHASKTFTIEYPNGMPEEFFGAFLRGVIDGDGTIWLKKRRKGQRVKDCRLSFVSASKVFVEQMQEELKKRNIRFAVAARKKYLKNGKLCSTWKGKDLWCIKVCHAHSLRSLYVMMYPNDNVPCLHRKRDLFKEYYETPRVKGGNPNHRIGFWDDNEKLIKLKEFYLDPNGSIDNMVDFFQCPWNAIKWAANKKLGIKRPCYWTPEEDAMIIEHYPSSDWEIILGLLCHRNKSGIEQRAWKLNVLRNPKPERPEKQIISDLYYHQNKSTIEIGKIFNVHETTISNWMNFYSLKRRDNQWSDKEIERLTNMYSVASKEEILDMFPTRTWQSIISCANKKLCLKSKVVLSRKTLKDYVVEAENLMTQHGKIPMVSILQKTHSGLVKSMSRNPEAFKHISQDKSDKKDIEYWVKLAETLQQENGGILHNVGWLQRNGHKSLDAAMRRQPDKFVHIKQHRKTKVMSLEVRAKVSAIRKGKPWSDKRRQAMITV